MRATILVILVVAFVVLFILKRKASQAERNSKRRVVDRMKESNLGAEEEDDKT